MNINEPIKSSGVWKGREIANDSSLVYRLNREEIAELESAIATAKRTGGSLQDLTRYHFSLPKLAPAIRNWMHDLNYGRGFVLVKGFPVFDHSKEDAAIAYWAIGRHMGDPVPQSREGDLLGHVRDTGEIATNPNVRLYKTTKRQDFHTDGSDIVGLLCLRRAKSGGLSQIASSQAVFNEIQRRRPDLIPLLFEPMYWDSGGEHRAGEKPYWTAPICKMINDRLRFLYLGWYIRDAQRHPDVPRLTDAQNELLELIESIANDGAFCLDMDFEPGDIQFLKNSAILHCRSEYEDFDDPDLKRHLLRLWLTAYEFEDGDVSLRQGFSGKFPK
jgi:Taurine catabolism dioxygenase TauD, TfdA family